MRVRRDGVAPPVFLLWGIYSPLPSLLGIPTHKLDTFYFAGIEPAHQTFAEFSFTQLKIAVCV